MWYKGFRRWLKELTRHSDKRQGCSGMEMWESQGKGSIITSPKVNSIAWRLRGEASLIGLPPNKMTLSKAKGNYP